MIPPNHFWWLSRSPPPAPPPPTTCLHFPSKFEWSHLWILPKFSAIPPFGFSVTTDPQGINNDRSLMCFGVIIQHANMAYHVQRASKGPTIWLLREGGIGDLRKKYPEVWFWAQKSLAGKYLPYNSFVCQGKTFYYQKFGGKKFLRKLMKSPIPWSKSNGRPLITCGKSYYCSYLTPLVVSVVMYP